MLKELASERELHIMVKEKNLQKVKNHLQRITLRINELKESVPNWKKVLRTAIEMMYLESMLDEARTVFFTEDDQQRRGFETYSFPEIAVVSDYLSLPFNEAIEECEVLNYYYKVINELEKLEVIKNVL